MAKKKIKISDKTLPNQLIRVEKFRSEIRTTKPHKHKQYFEIVFLTKGCGSHTIDSKKYDIEPNVLFLIKQDEIHHWEITKDPEGYVLIIKKPFIENCLDKELQSLLAKLSYYSSLQLTDDTSVSQLFELLTKEKMEVNGGQLIIEGLLKALLAKILAASIPLSRVRPRTSSMYHSFLELLHNDQDLKNNVSYYALELNTTSQNLNAICRKASNQSASRVVAEYIIKEAKRLLIYTDSTISEISFELNFNDPSHFVKYFKRFTKTTPNSYREGQN